MTELVPLIDALYDAMNQNTEQPDLWRQGFMEGWVAAANHTREAWDTILKEHGYD